MKAHHNQQDQSGYPLGYTRADPGALAAPQGQPDRKLDRIRVDQPHAMCVREIKMGFRPFPSLSVPQGIGRTTQLLQ